MSGLRTRIEFLQHVVVIAASVTGAVWAGYRLLKLEMPRAELAEKAMKHEMDVRCAPNLQVERCGFVARHLDSKAGGRVGIEQYITIRNVGELPIRIRQHKTAAFLAAMTESDVVWDVPPLDGLEPNKDRFDGNWVRVPESLVAHPEQAGLAAPGSNLGAHCVRTLIPNEKCTTAAAFVVGLGDNSLVGARSSFEYEIAAFLNSSSSSRTYGDPCAEHRRSTSEGDAMVGNKLVASLDDRRYRWNQNRNRRTKTADAKRDPENGPRVFFKHCAGAEIAEQIVPYVSNGSRPAQDRLGNIWVATEL